jgi:cytochrome oxidase assembly protein ShyY1
LALLAVVLLAATVMARLGEWQLTRARDQGAAAQRALATRPAVALASLLRPQSPFPAAAADRAVTMTGTWDGAGQLLVAGRLAGSQTGWWVLTPLRFADGSGIAVVRGWTATPHDAAASTADLPGGPVQVTGVLKPGEAAVDRAPGQGSGLPDGQIDRIDPAALVQRWDYPIHTGFVIATSGVPAGLRSVAVLSTGSGLALQNLSYALQWWLFALFGLFIWWRLVRDDHRGLLRPGGSADPPIGDDDHEQQTSTAVGGAQP